MLAYLFVLVAVAVRLMPHPWMFTPVAASLLFFGARGSLRQLWIPLALMAASDVILTKFYYGFPFGWDYLVTWAWYGAILWLGTGLRTNTKPVRVIAAALASSVSFFLLSNFTAWAYWGMYPKTVKGLEMAYVAGLPFFRHTLEGDLLFTIAMFATPVALQALGFGFGREGDRAATA
ncbi:MAG TPA: DUF6580 family putative transport protein [Terriglobales bacterium]|nr:DUF6580 family putative transport protein [Terriglobales bacterium]